jgi:hypothetical protein
MGKCKVVIKLNLALVANGTIISILGVWVALHPGHGVLVLAPWGHWASWVLCWVRWLDLVGLRSVDNLGDSGDSFHLDKIIIMDFASPVTLTDHEADQSNDAAAAKAANDASGNASLTVSVVVSVPVGSVVTVVGATNNVDMGAASVWSSVGTAVATIATIATVATVGRGSGI